MKKILVLIAFVAGFTFASTAQTVAPKKAEVTATPTISATPETQNATPVEVEKTETKKECAKTGKGCCKDKKAEAKATTTTESKKACAGEAKKGKACCAHKDGASTETKTEEPAK